MREIGRAVMDAYDKTSIQINRCKRILALVDTYVETETASARTDLRRALMEEFEAPAVAPPVAAPDVQIMPPDSRWVEYTLEDGKKAVINAAGEIFMKADVMVVVTAESGVTMQHPSVRTEDHILRHAPVAAGSVDTPEFEKLMVRWSTAGGGRFGLHEQGIPELRAKIVEHIDAWGAQQRELGKQEALDLTVSVGQLRQRAEKAEAEMKLAKAELRLANSVVEALRSDIAELK